MPQVADIVLDGVAYMLVPGSYRRGSAGLPEGRSGRVVISDFVGGQRRALQLERDTSWDSPGVGPALFGQGIEPWPFGASHTDGVVIPVSTAMRVHTFTLGNAVYLGIGRYVYRTVALSAGSWSSLTQVAEDAHFLAYTVSGETVSWLPDDHVDALLTATATGNVSDSVAEAQLGKALDRLAATQSHLDETGRAKAAQLEAEHRDVRSARRTGRRTVSAALLPPPDVLGVYVFLPDGGGR